MASNQQTVPAVPAVFAGRGPRAPRASLLFRLFLIAAAMGVACAAFLLVVDQRSQRQAAMNRALVRAIQRPGVPLAQVQTLLDRGANPNVRDDPGRPRPLSWEAFADFVLRLRHRKPRRSTDGFTALMMADKRGRADIVRALISRGADVNGRGYDNRNVLIYWAQGSAANREPILRRLLAAGADVNQKDDFGRAVLLFAVSRRSPGCVRLLLERGGADVNARDAEGSTPLMHSVQSNNREVVRLLLEHGAVVNARDRQGRTALTRAQQLPSRPGILAALRQAAASAAVQVDRVGAEQDR